MEQKIKVARLIMVWAGLQIMNLFGRTNVRPRQKLVGHLSTFLRQWIK
jgi:hypothetical protein